MDDRKITSHVQPLEVYNRVVWIRAHLRREQWLALALSKQSCLTGSGAGGQRVEVRFIITGAAGLDFGVCQYTCSFSDDVKVLRWVGE